MIRLSELTALDIQAIEISRDLDVSPNAYVYRATENGRTNSLIVQEDNSPLQQCTRNNALAPFWSNVLLGTSNFYPEQALGLTSFHANSELHVLLEQVTLPTIQYKSASLFFSQGALSNTSILAHWIRVYCKRSNGTEVNLCSILDFANDSNIIAKAAKLFESQIYNEALPFEFIDVEYLLSSTNSQIVAIRELLFGNERPTEYFIEYSALDANTIDNFVQNGLQFTRVNPSVVNQQSYPITFQQTEMYANVSLTQSGHAIGSVMRHQKYNIKAYLNTLKLPEETYQVRHDFTITAYNSLDLAIQSFSQSIFNPTSAFATIEWRPLIDTEANHFTVDVTIRIENQQSGLVYRRDSTIIVTDADVHKFKPQATISIDNLQTNVIQNIVNRQVNTIVQSSEVPKIVQIEKRLYLQSPALGELVLYDSAFTVELTVSATLTGMLKTYLKIDNLLIENETNQLLVFKIPASAYATTSSKFLLLDSSKNVIAAGTIVKA